MSRSSSENDCFRSSEDNYNVSSDTQDEEGIQSGNEMLEMQPYFEPLGNIIESDNSSPNLTLNIDYI